MVQVTDQQAWDIAFPIDNGPVFLAGRAGRERLASPAW